MEGPSPKEIISFSKLEDSGNYHNNNVEIMSFSMYLTLLDQAGIDDVNKAWDVLKVFLFWARGQGGGGPFGLNCFFIFFWGGGGGGWVDGISRESFCFDRKWTTFSWVEYLQRTNSVGEIFGGGDAWVRMSAYWVLNDHVRTVSWILAELMLLTRVQEDLLRFLEWLICVVAPDFNEMSCINLFM